MQQPSQQWEAFEPEYRSEWERRYPHIPWNEVRFGFRYGWESAQADRQSSWPQVEQAMRKGWEAWQALQQTHAGLHVQQSWESVLQIVCYGWDQARSQ